MSNKDHKDGSMTTAEAGRMGGEATAASHGKEFYQEIGHKGGVAQGQRSDSEKKASVDKQIQTKMERGEIGGPREK